MPARRTLEERLWTKVTPGEPDACWEWTGARSPQGYGNVGIGGTSTTAQRLSWMVHYGDIPQGLIVRHRCDNPPCVNPRHLELGTHKDNVQDARQRSAVWCATRGLSRILKIDADKVRRRYAAGESQQTIADSLGVGQSSVSRIVRRVEHYSS